MAKITRAASWNVAKNILKGLGQLIVGTLTYIALCFDRLMLVPFVFVSHYSLFELADKPDKFSTFSAIRILIGILCIGIGIIVKWLF